MTHTQQDEAVLAYYYREAHGIIEGTTLAGLSLPTFRTARHRLLAAGALVRSTEGRYLPVERVEGK